MKYTKSIIILLSIIILGNGCKKDDKKDMISEELGVNISSGEIIKVNEDDKGWQGDGMSIVEIKFNNNDVKEEIEKSKKWHNNITDLEKALLYGYEKNDNGYGPYFADENDKILLPEFSNAYYLLINKQNGSIDNNMDILNNASLNIILAIYNIDENILYYCELDT